MAKAIFSNKHNRTHLVGYICSMPQKSEHGNNAIEFKLKVYRDDGAAKQIQWYYDVFDIYVIGAENLDVVQTLRKSLDANRKQTERLPIIVEGELRNFKGGLLKVCAKSITVSSLPR